MGETGFWIWTIPFLLQGILMFWDEFYFHEKRGLGRWESIGHPLDSLTVLVPLFWTVGAPLSLVNFWMYFGMAVFSCFFVTKDEGVHLKECSEGEQRLHAVLFVLHPILLFSAFQLWKLRDSGGVQADSFLRIQSAIVVVFTVYQTVRWRRSWRGA